MAQISHSINQNKLLLLGTEDDGSPINPSHKTPIKEIIRPVISLRDIFSLPIQTPNITIKRAFVFKKTFTSIIG
jgi:hypothetical protein